MIHWYWAYLASAATFVAGICFGFWFAAKCVSARIAERLTKEQAAEFLRRLDKVK